jgi:eukaryotic-like serine/threonine-protein kinase
MQGFSGALGAEEAIGRYRIVLPLGQGGTADVYLAVAEGPSGFHKLVVLKVLKKCFSDDPDFRAMFLGEARLAARLHHPNIVQTNEVIEVDGVPTLVMEYLDGQPLSQVIVRGKQAGFSLEMQLRVLIDALGGLHRAHELTDFDGTPLSVVHRDVSPHNLFVTVEGHAKVLDFGIAKLERSMVETSVGTIKGKLRYMAPEQVAGLKLDRRADVYAAGVILWEAVVGERMWKNCSEDEIRARVRTGDVPTPAAVRPDVPGALDRICRKALALRPGDRHATAQELADDVEHALQGMGNGVTHRDIGATVARLFADVRSETRSAIEHKLGRMSMTAVPVIAESGQTPSAGTPATAPATTTVELSAPVPVTRSRRRVLLGALGGVAIAAAALGAWQSGVLSRGREAQPVAAPAPPPAAPAEIVPPSEPPAERAAPPADDTPAPPAPAARAVRDGRAGPTRFVAKRAVPPAAPTPSPPAAVPAEAVVPAAKPAPDCKHPFFVDADGIKRFRPECM